MWTEDQYDKFQKYMEEKYPKIFSGRYGGFAIDAGWWHLIDTLCGNIQSHLDWKEKQGNPVPQVVAAQIKEKFGGLRFYYDGGDEYVSGLVVMAETWADSTCEVCGAPGTRRGGGWIKTLCDEHHIERIKRTEERNGKQV
jgi:hypothetical protein